MKKGILLLIAFLLVGAAVAQQSYPGLDTINSTNWVKYFDDWIGYLYDSHGCLHFTPADIYLLYRTIPPGIPMTVKKYQLKEGDPSFSVDSVPFLAEKTETQQEIEKHALTFKNYKTEIVVYPSLELLVIMVNGYPYAKVRALPGQPYDFIMAFEVPKDKPIVWDAALSTPTDPGEYSILKSTDHYLSSTYYYNTIVPFGAWIKQVKGLWYYQENNKWYKLPDNVVSDLMRTENQRQYNYYDINRGSEGKIIAARYAGHDFGKYVLLWTRDGKNRYPEMGYAAGELVYEQIILVKDLVDILTAAGPDDIDYCVSKNTNFSFYRELYKFKDSGGKAKVEKVNQTFLSYYKLFNDLELTDEDKRFMDPRAVKAFREFRENRLPRAQEARLHSLGLYQYLRQNSLVIDKQAYWYGKLKKDWNRFKDLRVKLRDDFERMGILSMENRQNIVEKWLQDRLEFRPASLPKQAKYVSGLSFSTFFKPDEESTLFTERERQIMLEKIRKAVKGEEQGLNFNIVDALNNYNFGILLNEILGDLYKSHGCMHVSPRNMIFLYQLLPVGAQMKVYKYSDRVSEEALGSIPYLAELVDSEDALKKLGEKFAVTSEVQIAVYPFSGDWVIFLKGDPFARLSIRGGPQTKFNLLQGRDKSGKPIFQKELAYPTSPGNYSIFKKVENYLSNIYHDQTIIPMGGTIKKFNGKWIFQDKNGNWKDLPGAIAADFSQPEAERQYTYYDGVKNASGEVVEVRWGSHPFGKYSIQTTVDKRTPWPELIHSSGDLMMEERQLINDLIQIMTAPEDELDQCIKYNSNFELYRICNEFVKDPGRTDLIQPKERAAYRLYYNQPLSPEEIGLLPKDVVIANKVLRGKDLTSDEIKVLMDEGIASRSRGNLKFNMEKILGLQFDTYQYVVTIQKYAHHYAVLKKNWEQLSGLRGALLKDFNAFVIKDANLFRNFMRELMLSRNRLEKLTQAQALQLLNSMLGEGGK